MIKGIWTLKEAETGKIKWIKENKFTSFGLTAIASAPNGGYVPPQYLALNSAHTTLSAALATTGLTTLQTVVRIDIAGDTQLVLSPNTANTEIVTFSTVTGTGPFTYTLSTPTTKTHALSDIVIRQTNINDTLTTGIVTPIQYDSVNAPSQWPTSVGGYQTSAGIWTVQFYFSVGQIASYLATAGLIDTQTFGSGNLHNHLVIGEDHTADTTDFELDIVITATNN